MSSHDYGKNTAYHSFLALVSIFAFVVIVFIFFYTPSRIDGFSKSQYAAHIRHLKKKVPGTFSFVIEKPFVVAGDESAARVAYRAKHTVRWAVRHLKKSYFKKDPPHIITIWLFKNRRSYLKYCWKLFRNRPDTPYGYYSRTHKVLVMNIATGGGTLVHEIVHPFMAANFKRCPDWLNEGLGSLYEQCGERNGKIVGFTNWRLAGLQRAIRRGVLPSFYKLCVTADSGRFYTKDPGSNYGQTRYLCYYLQEKKLLRKYYHTLFKNRQKDLTGYKTLKSVLAVKNMKTFQKKWEKWVLGLRY